MQTKIPVINEENICYTGLLNPLSYYLAKVGI